MNYTKNTFNKNEEYNRPSANVQAAPINKEVKPKVEVKEEKVATKPEVVRSSEKYAKVLCDLCNIRKGASAEAAILRTAPNGDEFKCLGEEAGYAKVIVDGTTAFIRKDLVKVYSK